MTRLTVRQWMGYGLVCAILIGMGCKGGNIFGLRDPSDGNAGDLVAKGQKLLRDGKPNEALAVFDQALKADSLSSEVRFYHAKATLQASGFSIVDLLRDVTSNFTTPGEGVPLHTRDTSLSQAADELKKTRLYRAAYTISKDLTPIRKGLTHGSFDSSSVALDLAIANTLYAILVLRDTNQDLEIKSPPDLFFDLNVIDGVGGFGYSIDNLDDTIDGSQDNAESFNDIIELLAKGDGNEKSIIEQILENLEQSGLLGDDTTIDLEALTEGITKLGDKVKFYFINTGVAGNAGIGDNDGDGSTDEETLNGIDDDGDGIVDEDTILNP